jgi:hypothetical protein
MQKIIAYWTLDTTDHIYYLRPDSGEIESSFFLDLFLERKSCFLGKPPMEIKNLLGKPTTIYREHTRKLDHDVFLYQFYLTPSKKYGKDAYIRVQDMHDTVSVVGGGGGVSIYIW